MQITNGNTTIDLDEAKILALIMDPEINILENIFAKHYGVAFVNVPEKARNTFFYFCRVLLNKTPADIADIYDISEKEVRRVTKICDTKMKVNRPYRDYMYGFYFEYKETKNAA